MASYLAPRDGYELQVCMVATELLLSASREIGVRDYLPDLGLDETAAAQAADVLEARLGRRSPAAALIASGTPEAIAGLYRNGPRTGSWSSLVRIREGSGDVPLVCIHPLGGNAFWYLGLARKLPSSQPVYGLQARGLDLDEPVQLSIEQMAHSYISELQSLVPHGRYALMGWSFGGIVAYEMARQLRAASHDVSLIALCDVGPENIRQIRPDPDVAFRFLIHAVGLDHYANALTAGGAEENLIELTKCAVARKRVPPDYTIRHLRRMLEINYVNLQSLHDYTLSRYSGEILLFRATATHNQGADLGSELLGWDQWTKNVRVCQTGGSHFDALSATNLNTIAPRLTAELSAS